MRIASTLTLVIMILLGVAGGRSRPATHAQPDNESEPALNRNNNLAGTRPETAPHLPHLFTTVAQVQSPLPRTRIRALDLLTEDFGWVLTETAVLTTNDGGKNWRDITPALKTGSSIDAVFFLDKLRGWFLISRRDRQETTSLTIIYTLDGGSTWDEKPLQVSDDALESYSASAYINFIDPVHGWVMLRQSSSANFSRGSLLVTSDGGSSWEQLPSPPIANPIKFVSDTEGWLAGGPNGDQLYWTRDSGKHWARRSVAAPPADIPNPHTTYELPVFENSRNGVLAVTFTHAKGIKKVFYRTQNGGETWEPGTMSLTTSVDEHIAASVVNSRTVIVVPSTSREIEILQEGRAKEHKKLAITENTFTQIDFVSSTNGWLLLTEGACAGFKTDCKQVTRLIVTSDGGATLTEITPRNAKPEKQLPQDGVRLPALTDSPGTSAATVTVQNREGFDRCAVPTVSQMQTWWTTSPYKAAGVYIGGENHSCKTQNISSSWITSILNMGWGIIPTWVGPQAPSVFGNCQTTCSKMSTNATTAESQGVAEANKAADQAVAYGLSGSIIYYDMEAYDRNASGAVVRAFMNGWSRRLRERGFKAGGYSSRLTVSDWANIANPPDAIWFTWFFQDGVPCGDDCHTVFGVPGISDSLWVNHQRIRQTSSGFNRCWGSTCLMIDEDWLDGPVAGGGSTSGCSVTVGQGTSGAESSAFQNAYNAGGGQPVLGCATAGVRFDGFTSFAGTIGHFQTLANGEIEYLVNGSRAGQAFAMTTPFADKWESFGFTSNNPLGYPIGHRTAGTSPSCANTNHEFQSFEGGSLTRHLNGSRSGSVFEVHGAIHAKWQAKGFASCPLGLPISDERAATTSGATGKSGRVNDFERGHIHWWTNAPQAFETHGAIDSLYTSMGGTGSWLGFPTSDEYIASTGRPRSDFEGGFITTTDGVTYTAFSNNPPSAPPANPASNVGPNSFTANWSSASGATGYRLDVSTSNTFNTFVSGYQNLDVGNTLNRSVTGLTSATTYCYRVRAYNGAGASGNSNVICVTTSSVGPANNNFANAQVISGMLGTVNGSNTGATKESGEPNHADLSGGASVWYRWQAPTTGSVTFATTGSSFDTVLAAYTGSSVTALTLVAANDDFNGNVQSAITFNAQSGVTYQIAIDGFNATTGSIVLGWGQKPPAPSSNPGTNVTSNSFTANWSASAGASGYELDVSTTNTFATFISGFQNLDVGNVLSRGVTGLSPGVTYFYRVRAYNSAGTSNNSGTINVTTGGAVPPAPVAGAATNVTTSSLTANWNSATGAAGYRLDVSTSNTFSSFVTGFQNLDVGNVLSRNVNGLSAGTTYFYRVRAYNNAGTSGNSNTISAGTPTQTFTISVTASPSNGGVVSGEGTFAAGSSRTVTATANPTHIFANWTEGAVVVSTSSSFTFVLNANRSLVANFTAIPTGGNATYDSILRVPKCGQPGSVCDSGGLLNGRDSISGGGEPNQPNTLFNSCADNTSGSYHNDESIDRIKITTLDGGPFAPGKTIKIDVTVWAFSVTNDFLDLFHTSDVNNPNWTLITTLIPSGTGAQVLSATFTIPNSGGVHAIRANFLFQGAPMACSGGANNFDDHDDLAFTVQQPSGSTWQPTVLAANQVELKSWKVDGRAFVYAKLTFPDAGYRVANWGTPTRAGNAFSDDATIEKFNGGSAQVITSNAQIWDLGALAAGNYSFTFKNSGTNVKTLNFTVSSTPAAPNPIDDARTFVFWQYKDFLRRDPDAPGWDHWTAEITQCSNIAFRRPGETEPQCVERKRENTSAAFFVSPESQNIAYFVLRVYRGSLGRMPFFGGGNGPADEFTRDAATVGQGIVVNNALDHNRINTNKQAFVNAFVSRSDFKALYDGLTNLEYVDELFRKTGVTPSSGDRQALINGLNGGTETRASVLFKIVDGTTTGPGGLLTFNTVYGKAFYDSLFNAAFVQMEYFGYLQRDPDPGGYNFWLGKLNTFGDWVNAEMVRSFIKAPEYRARFGAP